MTGGELDTSVPTRKLGLALLGSPLKKRLALSFVSLELASLRWTTDLLHACLLGGWTHSLLYRRPFMSILDRAYKLCPSDQLLDQDKPRLCALPRDVAQELVLLAVLAPLLVTDLSAKMSDCIFAMDSSDQKGAYVSCSADPSLVRALWRNGRRKGGYVRMLTRTEALIRKLDVDKEEHEFQDAPPGDHKQSPEKPLARRFHFIEVCGGSGKVSRYLSKKGWNTGPILDLDGSRFFNLRSLRLLAWVFHLLEQGLLDSYMLEPPCTTFSPAQHRASGRLYT